MDEKRKERLLKEIPEDKYALLAKLAIDNVYGDPGAYRKQFNHFRRMCLMTTGTPRRKQNRKEFQEVYDKFHGDGLTAIMENWILHESPQL